MLAIDYGEYGNNLIELNTKELEYMIKTISFYIRDIKESDDNKNKNVLDNILDLQVYNKEFLFVSLPSLRFKGKELISVFIYKHLLTYILNYNSYIEGFKIDLLEYGKQNYEYKKSVNASLNLSEEDQKLEDMLATCEYLAGEHIIKISDLIGSNIKFVDELIRVIEDINELFKYNENYKNLFSLDFLKGLNVSNYGIEDRISNNYRILENMLDKYFDESLLVLSEKPELSDKFNDDNFEDIKVRYQYVYSIIFDVIKLYFLHKVSIYNENEVLFMRNHNYNIPHYSDNAWAYLFYLEVSKNFHTRNINILKDLNERSPILKYGVNNLDGEIDLVMEEQEVYCSLSKFLKNVKLDNINYVLNVSTFLYYLFLIKGIESRAKYDLFYNEDNKSSNNKNSILYDYTDGTDVTTMCINYIENRQNDETTLLVDYIVEDILSYPSIVGDLKLDVEQIIENNSSLKSSLINNSSKKYFSIPRHLTKVYECVYKHVVEYLKGESYELSFDVSKLKNIVKRSMITLRRDSIINTYCYIVASIIESLLFKVDFKYTIFKKPSMLDDLENNIMNQEKFLKYLKDLIINLNKINVIDFKINYNNIEILGNNAMITDNILDPERLELEDIYLKYLNKDITLNDVKIMLKGKNINVDYEDDVIIKNLKKQCRVEYNIAYSNDSSSLSIELKILLKTIIRIVMYEELTLYNLDKSDAGFKPMLDLTCDMLLLLILRKNKNLDKNFNMFIEEDYLRYYVYDIDKYMNKILNKNDVSLQDSENIGFAKLSEFQAALQIAYLKSNVVTFDVTDDMVRNKKAERSAGMRNEPNSLDEQPVEHIIKELINMIDVKDINDVFNIKLDTV